MLGKNIKHVFITDKNRDFRLNTIYCLNVHFSFNKKKTYLDYFFLMRTTSMVLIFNDI